MRSMHPIQSGSSRPLTPPLRPADPVRHEPASSDLQGDAAAIGDPQGQAPPLDARTALEEIIFKPWLPLPEALKALGDVVDESDAQALRILKSGELKGIWGDGGESAARQDLAILRHHLPAHASLKDAAEGYARLVEIEARAHSDPTPHARLATREIAPRLREGESMREAADVYGELLRFESGRDIDGSKHACEAYARVDAALLPCQTRAVAAREYMRDPDSYEKRQDEERTRYEARQAEVKRVVEQVSREPRTDLRIVPESDEWIVVGAVRVPRRA